MLTFRIFNLLGVNINLKLDIGKFIAGFVVVLGFVILVDLIVNLSPLIFCNGF